MHIKSLTRIFSASILLVGFLISGSWFSPGTARATGVLSDFTMSATSYDAGATTDLTFSFVTETALTAPGDMIFRAFFPNDYDFSGSTVSVTVDSNPATVGEYWNGSGGSIYVRLTTNVADGSAVVVTIEDVVNPMTGGYYAFSGFGIATADSGGNAVDLPAALPVLIAGQPVVPFDGGDGSYGNPYQISTCRQLQAIENSGGNYKLTQDVDCSETAQWYGGKGFRPIASISNEFEGALFGYGHSISHLTINRPGEDYVGLFAATNDSLIEHLFIKESTVVGKKIVGGFIGNQYDSTIRYSGIETSSVTATGSSNGESAGGLSGVMRDGARIQNSYSQADVTGGEISGGLTGYLLTLDTLVEYAYATGTVTSPGLYVGAFLGYSNGTTTAIFYDSDTTGIPDSYATPKTTVEMQTESTFTDANWNFSTIWGLQGGYPIIGWTEPIAFSGGDGTELTPYQITTCTQLQAMSQDLAAYYVLSQDIDCSGIPDFVPVGSQGTPFTGDFDGDIHTISNFTITSGNDYSGLFGYINGATLHHFYLNGSILGHDYAGGIAGYAIDSTIVNVSVGMEIEGNENVGGLIGMMTGSSTLEYGSASGSTVGVSSVGGLVGQLSGSDISTLYISQSYSTGELHGVSNIGGLIGYVSTGKIQNVYSSVDISQTAVGGQVGGLVGGASFFTIDRAYASGAITLDDPQQSAGGLVGGTFFTGVISKSFAAVQGGASVNGFYGIHSLGNPSDLTLSGNYYDHGSSGTETCYHYSPQSVSGCQGINTNGDNSYWKTSTNAPMTDWSPVVWNFYPMGDYPWLQTYGYIPPTQFDGGDGTQVDPYQISTCVQLQAMNENLSAHYLLVSDIDCSDTVNWNSGAGFLPIGDVNNQFIGGSFNGGGNSITSLYINSSDSFVGLFGYVSSVIISNVTLDGGSVAGIDNVGGFAGYIQNSLISNVHVEMEDVAGANSVGAFAGILFSSNVTLSSSTTSTVHGTGYSTGGFAGYSGCGASIDQSYATTDVYGVDSVGGFSGGDGCEGPGTTFTKVFASGNVVGTGNDVGGFVGQEIYNSFTDAYASGNVTGGGNNVGGFAGFFNEVTATNIYSRGTVTSNGTKGGLIGSVYSGNQPTNSFFDVTVVGFPESAGGTPTTTELMKTQSTFTDVAWDFDTVWVIDSSNDGYPRFLYLGEPEVEDPEPTPTPVSGGIVPIMFLGGGSTGSTSSAATLLDTSTTNTSYQPEVCAPYITSYIKLGAANNTEDVKKLQTFLNTYEGEQLVVDGSYKQADFEAVKRFQKKHFDVLSFWNLQQPTGYVYVATQKAINRIYCEQTKKLSCPFFSSYAKQGDANAEVAKIKTFLNNTQGEKLDLASNLYDATLTAAVKRFQLKYKSQALTPWGITTPTGNWYKSTQKTASDVLGCFSPVRLDNGVVLQ